MIGKVDNAQLLFCFIDPRLPVLAHEDLIETS